MCGMVAYRGVGAALGLAVGVAQGAAWLVLDLEGWSATWRRVAYDVAGAQAAIRAAGLPHALADRLEYGQ